MTFYAKLVIFWVVLFGTIWFLRRFPHHPVSQAALYWHGPYPVQGERLSKFMARRAIYSLKWFCQILLVFCALWLVVSWRPSLADTSLFMVFWFALPLVGGTLLLVAILYSVSAIKQHWIGPNPEFEVFSDSPEA